MSKNKRLRNQAPSGLTGLELNGTAGSPEISEPSAVPSPAGIFKERMLSALRGRWWTVAVVAVLSLSALGGTLKYLEQDAARQTAERQKATYLKPAEETALSKINPFLSNPTTTPTPELSREYVYAGASRLLAVEDANANPVIPVDLAVWTPSNGTFYIMGPSGTTAASAGWGASGDIPVPGDYDGDGKTDFAVYRGSTTTWYIIKSSDGSNYSQIFGGTGDIPVAADYDGDHRTDLAFYHSSDSSWHIYRSSDAVTQTINYGVNSSTTDPVVPADYDGDGRADAAYLHLATSTFYALRSSDGATQSGQLSTTITSGQKGVPADYDGDGKADYAMRSGSNWIIMPSAGGSIQTVTWYSSAYTAVQNDYDGDGKCDIAVWRATPTTDGRWYIRQSSHLGQSNELRTDAWGANGDIPVPAFWRR